MRLSFLRVRPAFRAYVKPRLSIIPFAKINRGRPEIGVIGPRVAPRVYANPSPRVSPWAFLPWRKTKK